MGQLKPTKTVYTVVQFLDWQRAGTLQLKPIFQRREVWKPKAKSLLIDTVVKGMPMPIVFLRQQQDLKRLSTSHEVIDGQQRLRTLLAFVDPTCLKDFDPSKDEFTVARSHNKELAKKSFTELPKRVKASILEYEISTHVFSPSTEDAAVLRIFARLNSTGLKLTRQELRNAQYYGEFKTLSFDLAFTHLSYWRKWSLFSDDDLARMVEVEAVSDYLLAMMEGVQAKSQPRLDEAYRSYDDDLPGAVQLRIRFEKLLLAIDESVGPTLSKTRFTRQALFYSLFTAVYDHMYGLDHDYRERVSPTRLPRSFKNRFVRLNERIIGRNLPDKTQDAMDKATSDKARRLVRHKFFKRALGLGDS